MPAETQFTGDAVDAAGPVLFTGKNKAESQVVGTSPPLVQGSIRSNPKAAAANEAASQSFLQNAISGGLTQKQTPAFVYTAPVVTEQVIDVVTGPGGRRRQLELFGNQPLDTPYLSTGKSSSTIQDPELGPDPSQRTGYARFVIGKEGKASKPVGTPSTGATTVGINYAALGGALDPNRDIGRTKYTGPIQTSAERLAKATGGTARPMSILPDRGDGRTTISIQPPAYDPRYKTGGSRGTGESPSLSTRTVYRDPGTGATFVPVVQPAAFELSGPAPVQGPGDPVRLSVGQDPQGNYAPQVLAGKVPLRSYPRMRGEALYSTGRLISDPDTRAKVKFPGRNTPPDEYVRPISERLGRGDTMQRFPIIRRG